MDLAKRIRAIGESAGRMDGRKAAGWKGKVSGMRKGDLFR